VKYELSQHARDSIAEREINLDWVERVLVAPARRERDRRDAALEHRLGIIDEFGGRVLRVVVNLSAIPIRIVTVYFDRKLKGKL
jgi:ribonuclease PH